MAKVGAFVSEGTKWIKAVRYESTRRVWAVRPRRRWMGGRMRLGQWTSLGLLITQTSIWKDSAWKTHATVYCHGHSTQPFKSRDNTWEINSQCRLSFFHSANIHWAPATWLALRVTDAALVQRLGNVTRGWSLAPRRRSGARLATCSPGTRASPGSRSPGSSAGAGVRSPESHAAPAWLAALPTRTPAVPAVAAEPAGVLSSGDKSRGEERKQGQRGWGRVEWYLGLPPCIWAVETPNLCQPYFQWLLGLTAVDWGSTRCQASRPALHTEQFT